MGGVTTWAGTSGYIKKEETEGLSSFLLLVDAMEPTISYSCHQDFLSTVDHTLKLQVKQTLYYLSLFCHSNGESD